MKISFYIRAHITNLPLKGNPMSDNGCTEITDPNAYELVVVKCNSCGFHLGVDASWLSQTHEKGLDFKCACCGANLFIETIE
jgi:hypothetical protein